MDSEIEIQLIVRSPTSTVYGVVRYTGDPDQLTTLCAQMDGSLALEVEGRGEPTVTVVYDGGRTNYILSKTCETKSAAMFWRARILKYYAALGEAVDTGTNTIIQTHTDIYCDQYGPGRSIWGKACHITDTGLLYFCRSPGLFHNGCNDKWRLADTFHHENWVPLERNLGFDDILTGDLIEDVPGLEGDPLRLRNIGH